MRIYGLNKGQTKGQHFKCLYTKTHKYHLNKHHSSKERENKNLTHKIECLHVCACNQDERVTWEMTHIITTLATLSMYSTCY